MEYTIIRSNRKTISIQITREGQIVVRAPKRYPARDIDALVMSKQNWIRKHLEKVRSTASEPQEKISEADLKALAKKAKAVLPERIDYYAKIMGISYGQITIRAQKTRWGSCSSKGNLNFNCLLMLTPIEVIDSVIVHELCHRVHMNHSKAFYDLVHKYYPEYDKWNKWLKNNGKKLIAML